MEHTRAACAVLHILICDPDMQKAEALCAQINAVAPGQFTIQVFDDPELALRWIMRLNGRVDAIFLEVVFHDTTAGLALGARLRQQYPNIRVAFVSAHSRYCEDIFCAEPIAFLRKPIQRERLRTALQAIQQRGRPNAEILMVRTTDKQIFALPTSQLVFAESDDHNVRLHLTDRSVIECKMKMDVLQKRLPQLFIRCHQSYLVNPFYVRQFGNRKFCTFQMDELPCSNRFFTAAREQYLTFCSAQSHCEQQLYLVPENLNDLLTDAS